MFHRKKRIEMDPADPHLLKLLNYLQTPPEREPHAAQRGREQFLAELEALPTRMAQASPAPFSPKQIIRNIRSRYFRQEEQMNRSGRNLVYAGLAVLLVFLFLGSGLTAQAAQSALPGDALYTVKTTLEQTRLSLSGDAARRADLQLEFAEKRLEELAGLIAEGRTTRIAATSQEFQQAIEKALAEVDLIAQENPELAASLMLQISSTLSRFSQTLTDLLVGVPEPLQFEMKRALQATYRISRPELPEGEVEFTGRVEAMEQHQWTVGGYKLRISAQTQIKAAIQLQEMVRVRAQKDAGGQLMALEVTPVGSADQNANRNANQNANQDSGSANSNSQSNTNENGNFNANQNYNYNYNNNNNENSNFNANQNYNYNNNNNENSNFNANQNYNYNNNNNENSNFNANHNYNFNNNENENSNFNANQNYNYNNNENENSNQNSNHNGGG
jgi:hypothetical protein